MWRSSDRRVATVIIRLGDETMCALPSWMLDEIACAAMHDETQAAIAVSALLQLASVLECHATLVRSGSHEHPTSEPLKGEGATKPAVAVRQGKHSKPTASSGSDQGVPRAVGRSVARRCSKRNQK